jgi:hypothetical protein
MILDGGIYQVFKELVLINKKMCYTCIINDLKVNPESEYKGLVILKKEIKCINIKNYNLIIKNDY